MPLTDTKLIERLDRFLSAFDKKTVSEDDFAKSFENVVNLILKVERQLIERNSRINSELLELQNELQKKLEKKSDTLLLEATRKIDGFLKRTQDDHAHSMAYMEERLNMLKDGHTPTENELSSLIVKLLPEIPEVKNDTPVEVRNKLEILKGEERLDKSSIRGLEDELKTISERVSTSSRTVGLAARQLRGAKFSFAGNDATRAFTLPNEPAMKGLAIWAYYQGAWLQPDVHFVVTGKTFTCQNFTPVTGSTIEGFIIVF